MRAIYELYDRAGERGDRADRRAAQLQSAEPRGGVPLLRQARISARPTTAQFKERSVRVEKLQDMLALHNRTLPDNALTYEQMCGAVDRRRGKRSEPRIATSCASGWRSR